MDCFAVPEYRIGTGFHTPTGFVKNGGPMTPEQVRYLVGTGLALEPCDASDGPLTKEQIDEIIQQARDTRAQGYPTPTDLGMSATDIDEMMAANKALGIEPLDSGRSQLQSDLAKGMREILAPMSKMFHRASRGW